MFASFRISFKGAWPLQKISILQFRSCKFSEMRSRLLAKRCACWSSKSFERQSRTFYLYIASCVSEGKALVLFYIIEEEERNIIPLSCSIFWCASSGTYRFSTTSLDISAFWSVLHSCSFSCSDNTLILLCYLTSPGPNQVDGTKAFILHSECILQCFTNARGERHTFSQLIGNSVLFVCARLFEGLTTGKPPGFSGYAPPHFPRGFNNRMLVSQSINKVKVASTLERFARKLSRTMSAKFQHF